MSMKAPEETVDILPFALADQFLSYAKSVEAASPDIFRKARIRQRQEITNKLVFIAGVRKQRRGHPRESKEEDTHDFLRQFMAASVRGAWSAWW